MGLHRVLDLGIWWQEQTRLPLPLAGMRCAAHSGRNSAVNLQTIRDSVSYGLEHREEALNYAMQFAREMDTELADNSSACTSTNGPSATAKRVSKP